jgi:hypothetical protein
MNAACKGVSCSIHAMMCIKSSQKSPSMSDLARHVSSPAWHAESAANMHVVGSSFGQI